MKDPRYFSVSENSVSVDFGNEISVEINRKILNLSAFIRKNPFPGLREIVSAYSSLTVFYDLQIVSKNLSGAPTVFEAVKIFVRKALEKLPESENEKARLIEIPFRSSDEFALDLEFISKTKSISKTEIIEIFTSKIYRVFMLGFLPGFAYMGEVDERIAVPRRSNPRLKVPKGSVGIAGNQTGIYPFDSPGGWQIIGKTEIELFTPDSENPSFLEAGDSVKFTAK